MSIKHDTSIIRKMPERLAKLREEGVFCDIILKTGNREIFAHRIILVTLSEYFALLFKYEGGLSKPIIEFDNNLIKGDCLEIIVNYAYTGQIDISEENVYDLLLAADYFDITFIKRKCEEFLIDVQISQDGITCENLLSFIWLASHFSLTSLLEPICDIISKTFLEESMRQVLMSLSPEDLLILLREKSLTVMDNGIPVANVDLELFQFLSQYINEQNLSDQTIIQLVETIKLSNIENAHLSAVVKSCSGLHKNSEAIDKLNLTTLHPEIDQQQCLQNCSVDRKFSKVYKRVSYSNDVGKPFINIDDRISCIKVYTFTGMAHCIPKTKNYGVVMDKIDTFRDVVQPKVVIGLSLQYKSGLIVTTGSTMEEPTFPFDSIDQNEIKFRANEVVIQISRTVGILDFIIFTTNLGNKYGSFDSDMERYYLITHSPQSEFGYFHSFEQECQIDDIRPIWVEYNSPPTSPDMLTQSSDDSADDKYYPYPDSDYHYYHSDSTANSWMYERSDSDGMW